MLIALNEIKKFVENDQKLEAILREYAGTLAEPQFNRLGWAPKPGESESDTKLRSIVIGLMIYSEREDVVNKALAIFNSTPLEALDPNLRVDITATVVRYAKDQTVIDRLLAEHRKASSSELKEDIASALTATRDPQTIQRLFGLLKDQTVVRPQDFMRWFIWLLRNRYARNDTWQWGRDNWAWMENTFSGDKSYDAFPRYVAICLMTETQLQEYKDFFTPLRDQVSLKRNIDLGIVELTSKIQHIARDQAAVEKALLDL